MCKHKTAGKGQKIRWDIYLEDPTPQSGESKLERDLRLSLNQVERMRTEGEASPIEPPATSTEESSAPVPAFELQMANDAGGRS